MVDNNAIKEIIDLRDDNQSEKIKIYSIDVVGGNDLDPSEEAQKIKD